MKKRLCVAVDPLRAGPSQPVVRVDRPTICAIANAPAVAKVKRVALVTKLATSPAATKARKVRAQQVAAAVALAARRSRIHAPAVAPPIRLVRAVIRDPMPVVKVVHQADLPVGLPVDQLVDLQVVRQDDQPGDQPLAQASPHREKVDLADQDRVVVLVELRVDREAGLAEAGHRVAKVDRANVVLVDPVEANASFCPTIFGL